MRKKISKSLVLLGLAVAVCILCAAIIGTRALTLGELKKQLVSEAKTLASLTANEENSAEFLSKGEYLQRVTLIGADGSVLMDNESAASNMENHLEREEIASAIKTGEGWASRFSVTRGEEYLYYAMRLPTEAFCALLARAAASLPSEGRCCSIWFSARRLPSFFRLLFRASLPAR
ncbi:MAG: hypothetical protein PHN24_10280 [Eubacteriales bacterium]|nr:hypothetical protein [Eubacteriales bacterium]